MNSFESWVKSAGGSLLRVLILGIMTMALIGIQEICPVFAANSGDLLYVSIQASVKWDEIIPEERRDTGHLNISISGTMVRNDASSPVISGNGQFFRPALNYTAQSMAVTYVYSDSSISLGPLRPGECEPRVPTEYHGTVFGDAKDSAGLSINLFSSMAAPTLDNLTPDKKKFIEQFQQSSTLFDWFQFHVAGPGKGIIPGTTQERKPSCAIRRVEKEVCPFSIGLQMKIPSSGIMEGSRNWSADTEGGHPPSFKISISDINMEGASKPLDPEPGGKNNVTYSVSWYLGEQKPVAEDEKKEEKKDCEKLAARIEMIENILEAYGDPMLREAIKSGYGENATDEYQDAVEKRVMEQVPRPEGEPPPKAKALMWTTPFTDSPQGGNVNQVTINGKVNGTNKVLITYDGDGKEVGGDYDSIEALLSSWENQYGEDAGRILFNASLEHEKVHVQQYADDERGIPETIDEHAEYEMEAFTVEMNYLMEEFEEMGCP